MIPEDQSLRHRALRVRHARHPEGPRGRPGSARPRPHLAVAALRDRRDHAGLHQAGRGGGHPHAGSRPTAPPARPTPRGSRSRSPPTSPTRPSCPTSTCCTSASRKAIEAAMMMAGDVPAHRLPPRGDGRPPAGRLPHRRQPRRQGQPAAAAARGRRGALGAPARRRLLLGHLRPRLLQGRDQVRRPARRRVPGQVGLRRHRVPAARPGQRGPQARPVLPTGSPSSSQRNPADRFGLHARATSPSG